MQITDEQRKRFERRLAAEQADQRFTEELHATLERVREQVQAMVRPYAEVAQRYAEMAAERERENAVYRQWRAERESATANDIKAGGSPLHITAEQARQAF